MKEHLGDLRGKKVVILGDILFSRVARSNIHALTKLGAAVTLCGTSVAGPHKVTLAPSFISAQMFERATRL